MKDIPARKEIEALIDRVNEKFSAITLILKILTKRLEKLEKEKKVSK